MIIKSISIQGFRNISSEYIELADGLNAFTGGNAQGKSSFLEAAYFILNGRSFRTPRDRELIMNGMPSASVKCLIDDDGLSLSISSKLAKTDNGADKSINAEGKKIRKLSEFIGKVGNSVFSRDDISLITGAPAERRSFIDRLISSISPVYLKNIKRYGELIKKKNYLLKSGIFSGGLAEAINEQISGYASFIEIARKGASEKLSETAGAIYTEIFGMEQPFSIQYSPNIAISNYTRETASVEIYEALRKGLKEEDSRRMALKGPHRDDLLMMSAGFPSSYMASQGQHRAQALSLKLAEGRIIEEKTGKKPVIFMDDCFSEMDSERKSRLLKYLSGYGQVLISSPEMPEPESVQAEYRIKNGRIIRKWTADSPDK